MVHVIKKGTPEEAKRVKIFTEPAIQAIVTLFGAFSGSNGLRSIFYVIITLFKLYYTENGRKEQNNRRM